MYKSSRRSSLALGLFFFLRFTAALRAETFKFPKDKPALTVEVPAAWSCSDMTATPGGLAVSARDDSGFLYIKALPEDAEASDDASAKDSLTKVAQAGMMKAAKDVKFSDSTETTVAGHKAYTTTCTFTYHDQAMSEVDTIFTSDGETYYLLVDMKGNAKAIIDTIKAAK